MMSYAGQYLVQGTADLMQEVQGGFDLWWSSHGAEWSRPRLPLSDSDRGVMGMWPPVAPRLNSLYWPAGASRWACGWYLCDEQAAASIRAVGSGTATLLINDGLHAIQTSMYVLPLVPLYRVAYGVPGLYLVTLVDDRFWWWHRHGSVTVTAGSTTWGSLYQLIASVLGITLSVNAVDAAYLKPSSALNARRGPLAPLLDLVATCCGQRIVRNLDGTVVAMNVTESLQSHSSNLGQFVARRLTGHQLDLGV